MSLITLDQQDVDTIEIGNLEYDVASIGAAETSASMGKQPAYLIFYMLPERG